MALLAKRFGIQTLGGRGDICIVWRKQPKESSRPAAKLKLMNANELWAACLVKREEIGLFLNINSIWCVWAVLSSTEDVYDYTHI